MLATIKQDRLRKTALRLRLAAIVGAALLVLATVVAVLMPSSGGLLAATLETDGLPHAWAAATALVSTGLTATALLALARMLAHTGRGRIFEPAATGHFRRFALWLMLAAIAQVALPAVATLLLAFATPQGAVALAVTTGDLLGIFLAAIFYFVANLFDEAARLDEDNRSII